MSAGAEARQRHRLFRLRLELPPALPAPPAPLLADLLALPEPQPSGAAGMLASASRDALLKLLPLPAAAAAEAKAERDGIQPTGPAPSAEATLLARTVTRLQGGGATGQLVVDLALHSGVMLAEAWAHLPPAPGREAPAPPPIVPAWLTRLAELLGARLDGRAVATSPWLVDRAEADAFVELLLQRRRKAPVLAIALSAGGSDPAEAVLPVASLAQQVAGLAHIAVLTGQASFRVTDAIGKVWSVYNQAVRIYLPGLDPEGEDFRSHPLFMSERARDAEFPDRLATQIAQYCWSHYPAPPMLPLLEASRNNAGQDLQHASLIETPSGSGPRDAGAEAGSGPGADPATARPWGLPRPMAPRSVQIRHHAPLSPQEDAPLRTGQEPSHASVLAALHAPALIAEPAAAAASTFAGPTRLEVPGLERLSQALDRLTERMDRTVQRLDRLEDRLPALLTPPPAALPADYAALQQRLAQAEAQLHEASERAKLWEGMAQDLDRQLEDARRELQDLLSQNERQRRRLTALERGEEALPKPLRSLEGFTEWLEQIETRIVVLPRAVRMVKGSSFEDPELIYRTLLFLAGTYRDARIRGVDAEQQDLQSLCRKELGLHLERSGSRSSLGELKDFWVEWHGRRELLDWHIKNGGNTRDPSRCFRCYFFWDEKEQIAVVGALPNHLETQVS